MHYKLIVFDMDGVIFTAKNFWLELHKALGTYEEGKRLTDELLKTDYEKLVQEVPGRLWKGKDSAAYFKLIEKLEYLPDVKEILQELQKLGYKTAIISSGPKHAALKVQKECGLDYYHTHDLIIGKDGKFTGEYTYVGAYADKEVQLRQFAKEAGCQLSEIVFVGHDYNDISALETAGLGVAINPETEEVYESADEVIHDMKELLDLL
jgi:phosphoserine phosphatase